MPPLDSTPYWILQRCVLACAHAQISDAGHRRKKIWRKASGDRSGQDCRFRRHREGGFRESPPEASRVHMAGHSSGNRPERDNRGVSGMSRFAAPYAIRFREDGQIEVFPAIEIFVLGRGRRGIRATFHIDSGATTSILPASDASVLGVNHRAGKKLLVRGVFGETFLGYRRKVTVQFTVDRKLRLPAIFVESQAVPRILGREGVFAHFGIIFDESKRRTGWLDGNERKAIDSLFH